MSPLHPAIVHFPIGLTIASVIADTAAAATGWSSLASAGAWMVLGAAAGVTVAVAAGYYDMKRDSLCEETHRLVHLHLRFGWGILIGLWILTAWRWLGAQSDAPTDIAYLILAWVLAGLVGLQGWFGGEMVYGHGAGVAPAGQGQQPPETAKRPSLRVYHFLMRRPAQSEDR
ncbi:MAG: DUF2231 domain-containing protein [Alphaproteobacteria bacterium]|jgi:uncharacterized membrane protein|nr:DUF2231 domain-containing protein [Alphaproteobacteria bacterium]MBU0863305.1 DUF2231 domain-containing protein [Alphaproteobacteria bacterium]MBU1824793.1 DUF2231 domain-containing protein [Alphaproteobacteria bacterium]